MKYFSNKEIAKLLRSISAAYMLKGENRFKVVAYNKAADSVEHATSEIKDLWDDGKLDTVPGLGQSIQKHLDELFKSGKVKHFEEVKRGLPEGMFEILEIPGMGPNNAYKLAKSLKIKNIKDLEIAARGGKIKGLETFGEKSEQDILSSISEYRGRSGRLLLPFAFATAKRVLDYLLSIKECQRAEPLGSLRRMVATVGDIDIGVSSNNPQKVIEHFKKFREVKRVLGAGDVSSSVVLKNGIQVDLKVLPPDSFGSLLQHFTGSKNHNVHLREIALKKGMSLSEHGIKAGGKLHKYTDEASFYKALNMDYIEPELREDEGEIEAAINHTIPDLVRLDDIKGDLHLHSNFPIEPSHDLGENPFEQIVKKAEDLTYDYIGLSDHSPGFSTHSSKQIVNLIKKRTDKIDQLKSSNRHIRILNLLEIDILTDGKLSVPEEGLKILDGSIAGIHSSHKQDKKTITRRLLNACESSYVQIISHPTGRLLAQRESYEVDWPKVFEACVKTKTMLEINSWPTRLDLPDTLVREAIKNKIMLAINTDAHAVKQMDNMKFGVSVARRGWARKENIANTLPWVEFSKFFNV